MALLQKAYLGATPLFRDTSWFEDNAYALINESSFVTVTANSSAHTKGAWSELIASTSANASLVVLTCDAHAGGFNTDTSTLLDIGIGASGSESVLIANMAIGASDSLRDRASLNYTFAVPVQVPSGSRLSARIQSVITGGKTADIYIQAIDTGDYAQTPSSVDTIGAITADSTGTLMSGASGTWVEITSATSRAYRAVVVIPSLSSSASGNIMLVHTLGTGASGSEVEIGQIEFAVNGSEQCSITPTYPTLIAKNIASGTRLAIKHNASSTPTRYGVTLIGIP